MTAKQVFFDMDDEPEVGVKELIKTDRSNTNIRREYQRMRAEKELRDKLNNVSLSVIEETTEDPAVEKNTNMPKTKSVSTPRGSVPEIASYPFVDVDCVDGAAGGKVKQDKHTEASEHRGHRHGAKLCMLSAMIHMKVLASRKPKSLMELKKNPITTKQEENIKKITISEDSDSDSEDEFAYLKKCRYLRGVGDKELSIDEIFG